MTSRIDPANAPHKPILSAVYLDYHPLLIQYPHTLKYMNENGK